MMIDFNAYIKFGLIIPLKVLIKILNGSLLNTYVSE